MAKKTNRWVFEPLAQRLSRYIGLLVFLLGIGLLGFTFYTAYHMFLNLDKFLPVASADTSVAALIMRMILIFILLFAMGLISSLIAIRGADLFSAVHQKLITDKEAGYNEEKEGNNASN